MDAIISIHAPKAGGTSTLEVLRRAYGSGQVAVDYDDDPANPNSFCSLDPVGWLEQRPLQVPNGALVVHGHFKAKKYDLVRSAFRFTMLRHPVDNVISIFSYWKSIPPQPSALHQHFLKCEMDILAFARLPLIQSLYSKVYFGDWDVSRLDFVGRHESRASDLMKLGKMLGKEFDVHLHENATERGESASVRERVSDDFRVYSRLEYMLREDIGFYERITGC